MKYKIGRKGTNLTRNGAKWLPHAATSFGWLGLIRQGRIDDARRWLKRMKDIGVDCIRVFGEYKDWEENFFFSRVAPLYDVWDWTATDRGSQVKILRRNDRILRRAIKLLQEFDMVMEYVISATAKAMVLPPWYQEHMARAIGRQFFLYEQEFGATNTYFEIVNEFDVTPRPELTADQISAIARRFAIARPENPGGEPDFPGALIGISQGGGWDLKYPTDAVTHINFHSPRGRDWQNVKAQVAAAIKKYKRPVILNENNHFMTKDQWDIWIPQIPKWAGISTKDAAGIIEQANQTFEAGGGYTLHYMTGMLTEPHLPLTRVEEMWKEAFNPGTVEPPPPPSEPTPDEPAKEKKCPWWLKLVGAILGVEVCNDNFPDNPPDDKPDDVPDVNVLVKKFHVSPRVVPVGGEVTVTWEVENVDFVRVFPLGGAKRAPTGSTTFRPQEEGAMLVKLTAGDKVRTRSVDVFEATVRWVDIEREKFGRHGVAGEESLHLGQTDTIDAIESMDKTILWDGVRNPGAALKKTWKTFRGIPREDVASIVARALDAQDVLRKYCVIDTINGVNKLLDGKFADGPVNKDEWRTALNTIIKSAVEAGRLNGIRAITKGRTDDFEF